MQSSAESDIYSQGKCNAKERKTLQPQMHHKLMKDAHTQLILLYMSHYYHEACHLQSYVLCDTSALNSSLNTSVKSEAHDCCIDGPGLICMKHNRPTKVVSLMFSCKSSFFPYCVLIVLSLMDCMCCMGLHRSTIKATWLVVLLFVV